MAGKDYYRILRLDPGADAATIKKAYRKLAMDYHPDRNPDAHSGFFLEILEAYTVLSDPARRAAYDRSRRHRNAPAGHRFEDMLPYLRQLQRALSAGRVRVPDTVLAAYLEDWLRDDRLLIAQHQGETYRAEAAQLALALMRRLPYREYHPLLPLLLRLGSGNATSATARQLDRSKYYQHLWHRYKFLFVLAVSLLLVGLMVWLGRAA